MIVLGLHASVHHPAEAKDSSQNNHTGKNKDSDCGQEVHSFVITDLSILNSNIVHFQEIFVSLLRVKLVQKSCNIPLFGNFLVNLLILFLLYVVGGISVGDGI